MSPWVRLDEAFAEHPKIAALSSDALALWIAGLAYCNRNLTDGFIPRNVGNGQLRCCDDPDSAVRELESTGLWSHSDGGWSVHDYLDYQPSRQKVLADREVAKNRMRRSREVQPNLIDPVPVTSTEVKASTSPPRALAKVPLSSDVSDVYEHWRVVCGKTRGNYDRISSQRKRKVEARLKEFSVDDLKQALTNASRDVWEDRALHNDLTVLLRSREQVDRFLDMPNATNGNGHMTETPDAFRLRIAAIDAQRQETA